MKLSPEFDVIYGLGFFLEIIGICFLAFAFYIMPHVFFGFLYPLPNFVFSFESWIDMSFHGGAESRMSHILMIFLPLSLAGILCLFEARNLAARIDSQLIGQDNLSLAKQVRVRYSENLTSLFRIILFVSLMLLAIWLLTSFI